MTTYFIKCRHLRLSDIQKTTTILLFDLIHIVDNCTVLCGNFNRSHSEFLPLIMRNLLGISK